MKPDIYPSVFGTHDESVVPGLWLNVLAAWCPSVQHTGVRLRDYGLNALWIDFAPSGTEPSWVVDQGLFALSFDGANKVAKSTHRLPIARNLFTACAWVKTTASVRQSIINQFDYRPNSSIERGWVLDMLADGKARAVIDRGPNDFRVADSSVAINDGNWHHVALVRKAESSVSIYVDGVHQGTDTTSIGTVTDITPANGAGVWIGAESDRGSAASPFSVNWNGLIDDVLVFNRVLADYELMYLAAQRGAAYERFMQPPVWVLSEDTIVSAAGSCSVSLSVEGVSEAVAASAGNSSVVLSTFGATEAVCDSTGLSGFSLSGSGASEVIADGAGTSTFVLAANASAESIAEADGAANADCVVSGDVEAVAESTGSTEAAFSCSGDGESTTEVVASCTITLTVSGEGESTAESDGSCSASLSSSGSAESLFESTGSVDMALSVSGDAASVLESDGSISCALAVSGVAESVAEVAGSATMILSVSAAAESYAEADGLAAMVLTVVGVGLARNTRVAPDSVVYVMLSDASVASLAIREIQQATVVLHEVHVANADIREVFSVSVTLTETHSVFVEI